MKCERIKTPSSAISIFSAKVDNSVQSDVHPVPVPVESSEAANNFAVIPFDSLYH